MNTLSECATARVVLAARHARRTSAFGILTVSGILGCASANGGTARREADFAGIARHDPSSALVATTPLAATKEDPSAAEHIAPAERVPEARVQCENRETAWVQGAKLARKRELEDASSFAPIGLFIALQARDPKASVDPWGSVLDGSDDVSQVDRLFGGTIHDVGLSGGLGLSSLDGGEMAASSVELKPLTRSGTVWVRPMAAWRSVSLPLPP
jgi:hypothetical protein